jgi:uncharacterized protein (DUF58 family)
MSAAAWLQILILAFLAGVLLDFPWLIYFSTAVAIIFFLAHQWRSHALDGLAYSRRFIYTRGFPGEQTHVQVTIENKKLLPISWVQASDAWPIAVSPQDENLLAPSHLPDQGYLVNLYSLRWNERITRGYTILFRKRGIYEIGPLYLEAGDLFGLYEQRKEFYKHDYLTVFPEMLPIEQLSWLAEDPFGSRSSPRPLYDDPSQPMGVRAYHPEDGFRRIHWPATARTGEIQVKVYQPVSARVMVLCLNVSTEEHFWLGYSPAVLEHMVKVCARLVYQGIEDGYAVGLFSNGSLAHADQPFRFQPGRSPNQLATLLQALAGVTPFVTAPFETFLIRSMSQIPFGATLVIVTALVPESLQNCLLCLRRYRSHITLISLNPARPPELPGIRILHLPFEEKHEAETTGKNNPEITVPAGKGVGA